MPSSERGLQPGLGHRATVDSHIGARSRVQYQNASATNDVGSSQWFNIVSIGTTPMPLSQLKIRYWFSVDVATMNGMTSTGVPSPPADCYYPPVYCSDATTRRFVTVTPARAGATHYLEVGFNAAAGTLAAGGQLANSVQTAFHYTNWWPPVVRTNDYSFDATKTTLTDWNKVTLYHCPPPSGACNLVWGTEPP